jgi:hypothetical protein
MDIMWLKQQTTGNLKPGGRSGIITQDILDLFTALETYNGPVDYTVTFRFKLDTPDYEFEGKTLKSDQISLEQLLRMQLEQARDQIRQKLGNYMNSLNLLEDPQPSKTRFDHIMED